MVKREKKAFLEEHFYYEVTMMFMAFREMREIKVKNNNAHSYKYYCALETFLLHARNLKEFLYSNKTKFPDDARAFHFFENLQAWQNIRPEETKVIKNISSKCGKALAHLTYKRIAGSSAEKNWDVAKIHSEMMGTVKLLLDNINPKIIGDRLRKIKNQLSRLFK